MDKINWPTALVITAAMLCGTVILNSSTNARDVAGAGGNSVYTQIVAVLDNGFVFHAYGKGNGRLCKVTSLEEFKCTDWSD